MGVDGNGLAVRQHERANILLPVRLRIENANGDQVVFTPSSGAPGTREASADLVDISTGGLGVISRQFVPRMCAVSVSVSDGDDRVIFEQDARVRRVWMESCDPRYSIGMSFVDPPEDIGARVEHVIRLAGRTD